VRSSRVCRVDLLDGRGRLCFDGGDRPGVFEVERKADPELRHPVFRGGGGRGPGSLLDRGEEVGECRLVGCFECPLDRRRGRGLAEDPRADPLKLAHEDGPVRPECRRHLAGEGLLDGLECPVPLHDLRQGDDAFEEVAERSHADTSRR